MAETYHRFADPATNGLASSGRARIGAGGTIASAPPLGAIVDRLLRELAPAPPT
jgi:hypothetical protein